MRDYKKLRLGWKAWKNKTSWKLVNENWRICHEIVDLERGHKCILCTETRGLQLDHCISRNCRSVFFEIFNLNYLCAKHHNVKSFNNGGTIDKLVDTKTRERIGDEEWDSLIAKSAKLCPDFQKVWYQEEWNIKLKEYRAKLLGSL